MKLFIYVISNQQWLHFKYINIKYVFLKFTAKLQQFFYLTITIFHKPLCINPFSHCDIPQSSDRKFPSMFPLFRFPTFPLPRYKCIYNYIYVYISMSSHEQPSMAAFKKTLVQLAGSSKVDAVFEFSERGKWKSRRCQGPGSSPPPIVKDIPAEWPQNFSSLLSSSSQWKSNLILLILHFAQIEVPWPKSHR